MGRCPLLLSLTCEGAKQFSGAISFIGTWLRKGPVFLAPEAGNAAGGCSFAIVEQCTGSAQSVQVTIHSPILHFHAIRGRLQSVKCGEMERLRVGKRTVHYMDMLTLVDVNKEVASLTREPSEYSEADGKQLESLLKEVTSRADNQDFEEAIGEKASLLIFKLASGQHFKAGNKRTALIAGVVFLRKNGFDLNIKDPDLISVIDKAGMAEASLDDVFDAVKRLSSKSKVERKAWDATIRQTVDANRKFLTDIGS